MFLIMQIIVFSAKGTISKATNKVLAKENSFFIFFILELLNSILYVTRLSFSFLEKEASVLKPSDKRLIF